MGPLVNQLADWGIVSLISIGGTYLAIAKIMQRKYHTLIAAEVERITQEKLHEIVDAKLDTMRRNMLCLTLITNKLCAICEVSEIDLAAIRRTCELNDESR